MCVSTCSPQVHKIKHARFLPLTLLGREKNKRWTDEIWQPWSPWTFLSELSHCCQSCACTGYLQYSLSPAEGFPLLHCCFATHLPSSPSTYWPSLWKLLPRSLRLCCFCCCYTITPHQETEVNKHAIKLHVCSIAPCWNTTGSANACIFQPLLIKPFKNNAFCTYISCVCAFYKTHQIEQEQNKWMLQDIFFPQRKQYYHYLRVMAIIW